MIWAGLDRTPPQWLRWGLLAAGAATILYNGRNYLLHQERRGTAFPTPAYPGNRGMPAHHGGPRPGEPLGLHGVVQ